MRCSTPARHLEARGAVIAGGTAIADATAFGQWRAAERLLERGAHANLFESAVMGLDDRVTAQLDGTPPATAADITHALWGACHGGRLQTAALLLARGADLDWIGWDDLTPLDAARRAADERPEAGALVDWLVEQGARSASELADAPTGYSKRALSTPSAPKSTDTRSPRAQKQWPVHVPVLMISSASRPRPRAESQLASQVREVSGWPMAARP